MAKKYNSHEVHPVTYLFVGFLLMITLVGVASTFNKQSQVYQSKAATCASPNACQTVHTKCCPGTKAVFNAGCGAFPRCLAPTRASTPSPTTFREPCRDPGGSVQIGQACPTTCKECMPIKTQSGIRGICGGAIVSGCRTPTPPRRSPTPIPCPTIRCVAGNLRCGNNQSVEICKHNLIECGLNGKSTGYESKWEYQTSCLPQKCVCGSNCTGLSAKQTCQ